MEKKEIVKRVEEILLKHEGNTSEGSIYWDFEWVGGKQIPTGGGGYRQEGGECVYADKAFYEEMANFISQELDRAREEGYQNCMDDIWEKARGLRSWTEHDGSVSAGDIEAGLREAYLEIEEELSKLTTK